MNCKNITSFISFDLDSVSNKITCKEEGIIFYILFKRLVRRYIHRQNDELSHSLNIVKDLKETTSIKII